MYDDIADYYHLIYPDWSQAVAAQGESLDRLLRGLDGTVRSVVDVSCGIGTQALGLAARGYDVTASDLSPRAITRARREATDRGLDIAFSVADMRRCHDHHGGGFDVVLSADNSLPHLTGDDLEAAVRGFRQCLRPGGFVVIGLRDYDTEDRTSPAVSSYGFRDHDDGRYHVFQTRDWDRDSYDVAMYFVRAVSADQPAKVIAGLDRYHALRVDDLIGLLTEVGFEQVQRLDGFSHQPFVVGARSLT